MPRFRGSSSFVHHIFGSKDALVSPCRHEGPDRSRMAAMRFLFGSNVVNAMFGSVVRAQWYPPAGGGREPHPNILRTCGHMLAILVWISMGQAACDTLKAGRYAAVEVNAQ